MKTLVAQRFLMPAFEKQLQVLLSAIVIASMNGCATNEPQGDPNLLRFLQDGRTSKEQVLLSLGEPWNVYEKDSVYAYRLAGNADSGYRLMIGHPDRGWHFIDYSLVLIFDENDVLKKHSLVPVQ